MTDLEFILVFSIAPLSAVLFGVAMLWFTRPRSPHRLHPGE
jgi:hypothetical protein